MRSLAASTIARPSGCSLFCSTDAASRSSSSFANVADYMHGNQLRPALGERAGLVDHERVDLFQLFERGGVLDEHALAALRGRRRP